MSSIEHIIQQIESEIQIDEQGRGKASIKATARLAGVTDPALLKAFQGANLRPSKLARLLMEQGFDAANLEAFPSMAFLIRRSRSFLSITVTKQGDIAPRKHVKP